MKIEIDNETKVIALLSGYVRELKEGKDYEQTTYKLAETIIKLLTTPDVIVRAIKLTKDLAEWSNKYPRERIYPMSGKENMDKQLIEIENKAKELIRHLPKT